MGVVDESVLDGFMEKLRAHHEVPPALADGLEVLLSESDNLTPTAVASLIASTTGETLE